MVELNVPADFSGVVSVDSAGEPSLRQAYGLANRTYGAPNRVDTRFAIASGSKGFVALAVVSLVESGELRLDTTARSAWAPTFRWWLTTSPTHPVTRAG